MSVNGSPEEATGPVIINASCTFLAPVNYPATVIIKMYAGDPGRSSVMTWYELFIEGEDRLYAEGEHSGTVLCVPLHAYQVSHPHRLAAGGCASDCGVLKPCATT